MADQADKDNPNATATVPITSAHNLRNVSDSTISRLYFCAPVTETENSQWRPMVKVGKTLQPSPWVPSRGSWPISDQLRDIWLAAFWVGGYGRPKSC